MAYDYQKQRPKLIFNHKFVHQKNKVFIVSEDSRLTGVLNEQHQKLYVLNSKGELEPGFPVAADCPAIWMDRSEGTDQFVVVTGLDSDVVAYGK